jgi:hypothetical protein
MPPPLATINSAPKITESLAQSGLRRFLSFFVLSGMSNSWTSYPDRRSRCRGMVAERRGVAAGLRMPPH